MLKIASGSGLVAFTFGNNKMIQALRYFLLITGAVIVSWNLSAYKSNISHSTKVEARFQEFTSAQSDQISMQDIEFFGALQKLGIRCMYTDGLYDGHSHRIPAAIFGGVLIIGGLLSFMVTPKKNVAEQVAASDC